MEDRFFYKEEIFFADKSDRELGQNQEKIIDSLRGNLAVGVVGGFFEEGYPVYFISQFALHNLGMSFEAFMECTGDMVLLEIHETDAVIRVLHQAERFLMQPLFAVILVDQPQRTDPYLPAVPGGGESAHLIDPHRFPVPVCHAVLPDKSLLHGLCIKDPPVFLVNRVKISAAGALHERLKRHA